MQLSHVEKISLFTSDKTDRESFALQIIDTLQAHAYFRVTLKKKADENNCESRLRS